MMRADKTIAVLTLILCVLIIWAGITGLTVPGFYDYETDNWRLQTLAQDKIDLYFIVPVLLNTALMISRGSQDARLLWAGAMIYVIYTYTIFCFSIHFNSMFLVYCAILGLSIFTLIYFIYSYRKTFRYKLSGRNTGAATGIYFMLTAVFFAMLWISEIVLATLTDELPASLAESGLVTNPVQVIDLTVCLPGLFITGLLLIRREKAGLVMAPVLLTFMFLMDITVGVLSLQTMPFEDIPGIALLMFSLAAVTLLLLFLNLRSKTHLA